MGNQIPKKIFDVIIIGAGPSGATLGSLLSAKGLDVILIDKAGFPRPKLCGGVITWKTRKLLQRLFDISFEQRFSIENVSDYYFIYEKYREKIYQKSPEPFYFVDRRKYDYEFISVAEQRSCQTLLGDRVVDLDVQNKAISTTSGTIFRGEIIVGADGANSLVRKRILGRKQNHLNRSLAFQVRVPMERVKVEFQNSSPKIFVGLIRRGYGWIFPWDEDCLIGLWGAISKNRPLKHTFIDFLNKVTDFKTEKKAKIDSCLLPAGEFLIHPGEGNILLTGDAAGFVDGLTGEGIYYAHRSAELASKVIFDYFDAKGDINLLSSYEKYLSPFLRELKVSRRLGILASSRLRYIAYFPMRRSQLFLRLTEMIHGIRSYSKIPLLSKRVMS